LLIHVENSASARSESIRMETKAPLYRLSALFLGSLDKKGLKPASVKKSVMTILS
jgi:hypothetical protein